jgi:hypothetical protein
MMRIFSKKHAKIIRFILRVLGALIANILIVGVMIVAQNPGLLGLIFVKNSPLSTMRFPAVVLLFFAYFIRYIAAILIVAIGVYYLVRRHKEVGEVRYDTYIDSELYAKFNVLASGVTPEDRLFWQAQRNIEKKMKEQGNNYQVTTSGAGVYSDFDEPKVEVPMPAPGTEADFDPERNPDQPIASFKNIRHAGGEDPLSDIPEFDPDGPDPFK